MHGARGGAPEGKRNGNYRHGARSKEVIALRKFIRSLNCMVWPAALARYSGVTDTFRKTQQSHALPRSLLVFRAASAARAVTEPVRVQPLAAPGSDKPQSLATRRSKTHSLGKP